MTGLEHTPSSGQAGRPARTVYNHCAYSPWVIGSREFNEAPVRLELAGVRHANRHLFSRLDATDCARRRGEIFDEYISVRFALHEFSKYRDDARRSLRNSYVRYLRGWAMDSNSIEGAVLKHWVESRFGIAPTWHRDRPLGVSEADDYAFLHDCMRGRARTNAIDSQLDALFEFCQYEQSRRFATDPWITLYRGTWNGERYPVLARDGQRRSCVLLNNLSSFTEDEQLAWEFGSTVWRVRVPRAKIFFFGNLLPGRILKGEEEYLVIGGEYWVERLLY